MQNDSDPTTDAELDVLGIGNALVDVISSGDDGLLDELGSEKGTMTLVDEAGASELYARMGAGTEVSGGSAANTVVGVAALGGRARYIGKVRDDQLGAVFVHDLRATGVDYSVSPAPSGPATGCCLVVVTPDAQRTMHTYLGASVHLTAADLDHAAIRDARILYLEGYLFDPPEAQLAFREAARVAAEAGRTVAITLSDRFCVERHREAFIDLVDHHADIVFANEEEILALYEVDDLDDAVDRVRHHGAIAVITRSERGSIVVTEDEVLTVAARPVDQLVDTTGAGDLFAAGFLTGFSRGFDLQRCAELGSVAAAEVISHVGPRPQADLVELAGDLLRD